MNKKIIGGISLLSIATLFSAHAAFAQSTKGSSIELYGVLDAAVGTIHRSLAGDPNVPFTVNPVSPTKSVVNHSVTGMFNGGISPSRWGIRGSEELTGSLKVIFTLESGLNLPTGNLSNADQALANNRNSTSGTVSAPSSMNGQLFGRQAFVGLADRTLGQITFGRNYTPMFDIVSAYDPVQNAQLFSPLGFSGAYGGGGGVTENARQDNSIKYKNKIADFNFGAMYKFGEVAGVTGAKSGYAFFGGYEAHGFGIQGAYQGYRDAITETNSATPGSVNVTNYNTSAYMIAAKYTFGKATIRGGFERITLKQPSDSLMTISSGSIYGYPIGNMPTTAKCTGTNTADFCSPARKTNILWIGGDYNFTPAFNLAVAFYDIAPRASADFSISSDGKLTGQGDGHIYEVSVLADYHFTKRTDLYAGFLYSKYKGNNYPNNPAYTDSNNVNSNNYIYAVGLRTKF